MGLIQWVRNYSGTLAGLSSGNSITIDNLSNVYITGRIRNINSNYDAVTQKYSSAGILLWSTPYSYAGGLHDEGFDIKLDNLNNIYVTGVSRGVVGVDSGYTLLLKYNNNGAQQWVQHYHSSIPGTEYGYKVLLDNSNGLFIMCKTDHIFLENHQDIMTLKYNTNGNFQWYSRFSDSYNNLENAYCMLLDNSNNIIVGGVYQKSNRFDLLLLNYNNSNGNLLWSYQYNRTGISSDIAKTIKANTDGSLFVSGQSNSFNMVLKLVPANTYSVIYNRNGLNKPIIDSSFTYDTILFSQSMLPLNAIVRDVNVTLDTILHPVDGDLDISLIHLGFNDTLVYRRGGPFANFISTRLDDTASINICNGGLPPYTGYFKPCWPLAKFNYLVAEGPWILRIYDRRAPATGTLKAWKLQITYDAIPIGIQPISSEIPSHFSLSQNYPNPFNPATKIRFDIPVGTRHGAFVQMKIYDILGREIATLVNEQLQPGTYEVEWPAPMGDGANYPSGIYLYRIMTNNYTETKKMILIR
jgi:subtilisin-like proprotein convertase family protein